MHALLCLSRHDTWMADAGQSTELWARWASDPMAAYVQCLVKKAQQEVASNVDPVTCEMNVSGFNMSSTGPLRQFRL